MLLTTKLGTVVGRCSGTELNEYGPDGEFCTSDDPESAQGAPMTSIFVTGTATSEVLNPNDGSVPALGPFSVAGRTFNCTALAQGTGTGGACRASAFTLLDQPTIADITVTYRLCAQGPPAPTPMPSPICSGDCDVDGMVTVDEIIRLVNIALNNEPVAACMACSPLDIDCIIIAVNNALFECPHAEFTPTPTPAPRPSPTNTPQEGP